MLDVVTELATPVASGIVRAPGFSGMVLNSNMDLFDLALREVGGLM